MQNKPNFQKAQMNVSRVSTRDYEDKTLGERGKNKPNSNPIQTQSNPIKANKMPKQTQYKPKQTQFRNKMTCSGGFPKRASGGLVNGSQEKFSKKIKKMVNGIDRYLVMLYTKRYGKSIF